MFVTKANTRSGLHRNDYLDYIGVRRFDADLPWLGASTGAGRGRLAAQVAWCEGASGFTPMEVVPLRAPSW